ncbi:MAG: Panacea domain-containing protein [Peptoanaerobacter stomatis]|uniref:Panacea domain-containing protein n=1 Tax=Peptoanaerobacter stomatis TaxID=796937 RepID=UPI003FA071FA
MLNSINVAKTLYESYFNKYNKYPDEMTMHKLMYFLQKECLISDSRFLFIEDFYSWEYGMILKKAVRQFYYPVKHDENGNKIKNPKFDNLYKDIESYKDTHLSNLISTILDKYGGYSAWELSALSHRENSWKLTELKKRKQNNRDYDPPIDKLYILLDSIKEKNTRKILGV